MKIKRHIMVHNSLPDGANALAINSGTVFHTHHQPPVVKYLDEEFVPEYVAHAYVNKRDWRKLTSEELTCLAPDETRNDHNTIYLGEIPDELKACFKELELHGGVGASGDLVQLAHLALTLIGEGEVFQDGIRKDTKEVFEKEDLAPITVALREGLALMNGTSVMTGVGLVNTIYTRRLLNWMITASCAINEIVKAYDDHLSYELNHDCTNENRIEKIT